MLNELGGANIALTAGVLVTGKTGSGKTSTAKRLIEDLCGYSPTIAADALIMPRACILDPIKSDWWGITLAGNGRGHGLPFVILGGPHGHVPLSESSGTALGELVASGKLPMSIIDMAYFKMGGLQRFYCDFAEAIFRNNKHPLYLVLEEAHEFAPKERTGSSGENMAVYWSKKLATAGRSKGLRMILATQATQSLHNSLMGSCETLLAHRMTLPAHIEPVTTWLKAHLSKKGVEKIRADMPKLSNGQAYIVHEGYVERRQFKMMQTFDNTKTPDGSEVHAAPPPVDRDTLLSLVGDAVKEAEENDPATLKARIKELEAKTAPISTTHKATYDLAFADGKEAGYKEGYKAGVNEQYGAMTKFKTHCDDVLSDVFNAANELRRLFGSGEAACQQPAAGETAAPAAEKVARVIPFKPKPAPSRTGEGSNGIGAGARHLIDTVFKFTPRGFIGFPWSSIRVLAGMRAGGHFNTARKQACEVGSLTIVNDLPKPFGSADGTMPTRKDVYDVWARKFNELERDIFRVVLEHKKLSKDDLRGILDKKAGGHWNTHFASVRDAGLIESRGGAVSLSAFVESLQ